MENCSISDMILERHPVSLFPESKLKSLQEKQFIKLINQEIIVREKSKLLIDFMSIESNFSNHRAYFKTFP